MADDLITGRLDAVLRSHIEGTPVAVPGEHGPVLVAAVVAALREAARWEVRGDASAVACATELRAAIERELEGTSDDH